jgi:anti-sigma B factor antagonist
MGKTSRWVDPSMNAAAAAQQRSQTSILYLDGPLHARQAAELRDDVQARLRRGERTIVLCLARVSELDAAGMGELVRAYNMTTAAAGTLRVTAATGRVRKLLDRVGLFEILTGGT